MNAFDISSYQAAGLIMDGAALFILAGMFIYTSLYRRRGKPKDKVFFALILTDIIAALFDCIKYIPGISDSYFGSVLDTACSMVFFMAIDTFAVLFCAYQMYRMEWDRNRIKRTIIVLCIVGLILVAAGSLSVSIYDLLNIAPFIICGGFTVFVTFKQERQILILTSLLIIVHICLTWISLLNVTPLFLSIYLMFTHLMTMRDSFYGEGAGL